MCAYSLPRTTNHLAEIEIGVHPGVIIDKPDVDESRGVDREGFRAIDGPRERVVKDCVGDSPEIARIVHQSKIGVELSIS